MGESLEEIFREMLGPQRAPYTHQLETAKSLLEGKSVVLRAPCGSGKSEAALVPFLQGIKEKNERLPQHLIYSLPMRVLTENLTQRVKERLHFDDVVAHHGIEVADPLFEKSLIFTTIDQTVGAYCCVPLSASLGAGNIPAGAVVSAMLCFDEVHTYDYERALNSMLIILESSKKFNSLFAILSATLPDKFLSYCGRHLGTEVIDVSEDEEDDIPCRKNREVKVQMEQGELTAEKVENCYHSAGKNAKILVVCNTVDKAQALYNSLKNIFGLDSCFLLHSRFLPEDREKRESELLTAFQNQKKMCAITTQVCEVGLDISCDILLTEVSPIDSFIQRVGRCARRGGHGQVLVFDVKNCKPYQDELVGQSLKRIRKLDGECLRWNVEKQLVNDILGDLYSEALNSQRYGRILGRLVEASFYRDRRRVEQSVREALTCKLTIHDNPESLGKDVLMMSALSVDVNVLKGFYRKVRPRIWFVDTHKEDYESSSSLSARVSLVKDDEDIYPYGFFVLHPEFSNYDEYLGLRLGEIGENLPSVGYDQKQAQVFEYRKEPWVQHAEKSLACFDELKLNYITEMRNISNALGIDKAHLETLIVLCIAFHDIGKLNREWQMAAGALDSEPLAHTREMLKPPPHSAISAYSLMKILDDFTMRIHCRSLGISCFYALAHHHSVGTERIDPYSFILQWKEYISNVLGKISVKYPLLQQINPEDISAKLNEDTRMPGRIPSLEFHREYVPYAFISRLLRLSDRRSQSA